MNQKSELEAINISSQKNGIKTASTHQSSVPSSITHTELQQPIAYRN